MEKTFYSLYDAGEYAALITNQWQDSDDDLYNKEDLLSLCETADDEDPLDEDDEECYYIVTDLGAIGITYDARKKIIWMFTPTHKVINNVPASFCENCGSPVEKGANFCEKCGYKLS